MKQNVTFLAKGGVCRVALDILSDSDSFHVEQICDDSNLGEDSSHRFILCNKTIEEYVRTCNSGDVFFNCIGNYHAMGRRSAYSSSLRNKGCKSINIFHSSAFISKTVSCGDGNLVCSKVVLDTNVNVGNDNIFFSGTVVEHDCRIGSNVYFSPSVTLCGKVVIGDNVYIGPGAVIAAGVTIGSRSIIGAGSVVLNDVIGGTVVYGVGAKFVRMNDLW